MSAALHLLSALAAASACDARIRSGPAVWEEADAGRVAVELFLTGVPDGAGATGWVLSGARREPARTELVASGASAATLTVSLPRERLDATGAGRVVVELGPAQAPCAVEAEVTWPPPRLPAKVVVTDTRLGFGATRTVEPPSIEGYPYGAAEPAPGGPPLDPTADPPLGAPRVGRHAGHVLVAQDGHPTPIFRVPYEWVVRRSEVELWALVVLGLLVGLAAKAGIRRAEGLVRAGVRGWELVVDLERRRDEVPDGIHRAALSAAIDGLTPVLDAEWSAERIDAAVAKATEAAGVATTGLAERLEQVRTRLAELDRLVRWKPSLPEPVGAAVDVDLAPAAARLALRDAKGAADELDGLGDVAAAALGAADAWLEWAGDEVSGAGDLAEVAPGLAEPVAGLSRALVQARAVRDDLPSLLRAVVVAGGAADLLARRTRHAVERRIAGLRARSDPRAITLESALTAWETSPDAARYVALRTAWGEHEPRSADATPTAGVPPAPPIVDPALLGRVAPELSWPQARLEHARTFVLLGTGARNAVAFVGLCVALGLTFRGTWTGTTTEVVTVLATALLSDVSLDQLLRRITRFLG